MAYVVAQTTGCVMATYAAMFVFGIKPQQLITRPLYNYSSPFSAFFLELLLTFILMFLLSSLSHQSQLVSRLLIIKLSFLCTLNYYI